jgi:glucose-6-phosphate isomerase
MLNLLGLLLSLHHDTPESESCFARFTASSVLGGLIALDSRIRRKGITSLDPSRGALIPIGTEIENGCVVKSGYGVFSLAWQAALHPEWADQIAAEIAEIRARIKPLHFLVWAGMGGSAEDKAMYQAAGLLRRGPRCYLLDSTDPEKLTAIVADMKRRSGLDETELWKRTLVVGMAMGMTSFEPVVNLQRIAARFSAARVDARSNIYCMTLPGSLLDKLASSRGCRRIGLQLDGANTTAGRHSGPLTRGSLYPLALAGVDLGAWIAGTNLSRHDVDTAWRLASFLHVQGLNGRNKVTFLAPRAWECAGLWTKQNFEESLGKSAEHGIKIVIGERVRMTNYRPPRDARQDRVFLAVQSKDAPAEKLALLRRAGYPMATLTVPASASLSRYMQFIHYTVFGLAWLRKINFVTQPNVELYKSIANKLSAEAERAGGIGRTKEWRRSEESLRSAVWRGRVTLRWDRLDSRIETEGMTAPAIYAALLRKIPFEYGELTFFGDTRYSARGRAVRAVLDRAAEKLFRATLKVPADVYEGPAMNHSYHEMIIGHGKCFSTVLAAGGGEPADYHRAQFLATQMALAERGRGVVSITLRDMEETSLRALDEFFRQAATQHRAMEKGVSKKGARR